MFQDTQLQQDIPERRSNELEALALFRAYRDTHDIALRDQLVCRHLHLVHGIARRFSGLGESLDDLVQEGTIGLLNAVDLFDPERGVKFTTYASHQVTSQIQHYLRDRGRLIRQPAWVQELNSKVVRATEQLTQELGRDPLPSEVAERLNLNVDSINHVLASRELNHVVSLNAPTDGTGENDLSLLDKEKSHCTKLASLQLSIEDRIVLDEAIASLKTLEQKVVRLFFFGDLNQSEIARKLGISINYSSYLLRRSTTKIKAFLDERQLEAPGTASVPEPSALLIDAPIYDRFPGVYTEAYLRVRVAEEISRSLRYPTNFALMILAVETRETVESQLQFLNAVSQFLRRNTRSVDLTAYLGGNRFGLLLPHTGREAKVLGDRLCQQIVRTHQYMPYPPDSIVFYVGFTVFPTDGNTPDMLFERAEGALVAATKAGPNTAMAAQRHGAPGSLRPAPLASPLS